MAANPMRCWVDTTAAYDALVAIDDGTTRSVSFGPFPTAHGHGSRAAIKLQSVHFACGDTKCGAMVAPSDACRTVGATGPCVVIAGDQVWPTLLATAANVRHTHLPNKAAAPYLAQLTTAGLCAWRGLGTGQFKGSAVKWYALNKTPDPGVVPTRGHGVKAAELRLVCSAVGVAWFIFMHELSSPPPAVGSTDPTALTSFWDAVDDANDDTKGTGWYKTGVKLARKALPEVDKLCVEVASLKRANKICESNNKWSLVGDPARTVFSNEFGWKSSHKSPYYSCSITSSPTIGLA
jgi:hypothetical protein